jgi:CubicO group peptidase (beta-lactamase class C family)
MRKLIALFLLLTPAFAAGSLDGLDTFVAQALRDWKVPGAAVMVVSDGKVVLSKGYGVRDRERERPVTTHTLFAIGSATKSFTVTVLGTLVDEGKLDWDKPVRTYLPDFRMFDEAVTDRMTPRDLVTHRSGLPRHDLMWYAAPFTRQEIYDRLRYLEPSKDFRSAFQYQNLMFMTAGYLAGRMAGTSWEDLVKQRIFTPLGMKESNFSVEDSKKAEDYALGYQKIKEEVKPMPFRNIDAIGPAGSINSNITDMANYLIMQMNRGKFDSKQVLSAATAGQMQSPQMSIAGAGRFTEVGDQSYGMGFFLTTYRGHKVVHHGGNIDGFSALVSFMPREKIGMVILTNMNGSPLPTVLSYNVYDRLLSLDEVAWTARFKEDEKKSKDAEEEAKKRKITAQVAGTHPSHALGDYTGEYEHPAYGMVKIEMDGAHLKGTLHALSGRLEHFHYDVFQFADVPGNPLGKEKVMFHTSLAGDIESLSAPIESSLKDIVFTRVAVKPAHSALEALAGDYQIGPQTATVALAGDELTLSIQGQPPRTLAPVKGLRFNVKGLNGFSVEFKGGELIFFQPNGTFVAKRK